MLRRPSKSVAVQTLAWLALAACLPAEGVIPEARAQDPAGANLRTDDAPPASLDPELRPVTDPRRRQALENLIEQLASPSFDRREQASNSLRRLWREALPLLVEEYRTAGDLEVRQRIEQLVFEAYIENAFWDRYGFLGIRHAAVPFQDRPGGPTRYAARVSEVVSGTAAEVANLQLDDLIIAFNDEPLPVLTDPQAFGECIRKFPPGTKIRITIVRRNELQVVSATLGRWPRQQVVSPGQPVYSLLEEANHQFAAWWTRNFEAPPPSSAAPMTSSKAAEVSTD
ncbi:MAG: PDZ domain-containing protein [Phycisphaerae bacterium]|nr:PDZ domain-containing protein [Phycisphaerae bacterium]